MKRIGIMVSTMVLAGSLAGTAVANDGVLLKDQAGNDSNYCHMKFPAIDQSTLYQSQPQLKDPSSGDVVDFYGPCSESPTGAAEVAAQKIEDHENRWAFGDN